MSYFFNSGQVFSNLFGSLLNGSYKKSYGSVGSSSVDYLLQSSLYASGVGSVGIDFVGKQGPVEYMNQYSNLTQTNGIVKYIYQQLFKDLQIDISGYVLAFMVPPELTGYQASSGSYDGTSEGGIGKTINLIPLLASNFSPPQVAMNFGTLTSGSGNQQYASRLMISDSMSVTYVDTIDLDVYALHKTWIDYIFEVTDGSLSPSSSAISARQIDYPTAFFFVKWHPDMERITYIGYAVGCTPKELPSSELLGNRSSNEATSITFNYTVADFYEIVYPQNIESTWLYQYFSSMISSRYGGGGGVGGGIFGSGGSLGTNLVNYGTSLISKSIRGLF